VTRWGDGKKHGQREAAPSAGSGRLWPALAGSSFGDWLGLLATTALAARLGAGSSGSYARANLAVAAVLLLRLAPAVLLGPPARALADRFNRTFVMVAGDVLRGLLFITIPIVGSLQWLFAATVLIEGLALFWRPAKDASVPTLVPRDRLEAAHRMSLVTTYGTAPVAALAYAGLELLNGILDNFLDRLATHPIDLALYVTAATFVVSGLLISRVPVPQRRPGEMAGQASALRSIGDGWTFIAATPPLRGLVVGMLGAFAAAGFVIALAPTFVHDLGAGQPGYGALSAALFLGLALGVRGGPHLLSGFSRNRLFGLALVAAGGFLAALALIPNIVMAFLFTLGLGACGGTAWITGYTLLGLSVTDDLRGRAFAFAASAARIALVLVFAIGPALAALIGRHTITFTDSRRLTYNGAAFAFLLAAVLVAALGVTVYRQLDDRPGARLTQDLRQWWADRRQQAPASTGTAYSGVFLAFEGGDGSGKSTQARLLADWLRADQGHDVVLTREPGATPVGVRLREVLLGHGTDLGERSEALLFAADRAHHVGTVVRPALERGSIVVTDRYIDSSVAYQGAGRELEGEEVARISRWATDGLTPNLTILLDVQPTISKGRRAADAARAGEDRLESLPDDFHTRVRDGFLELARREPHRYLVIDGAQGVEEIQEQIRARVRQVLPISPRRRAQLKERLVQEEQARERRAAAEAEVLRMDADLRARRIDEARQREESRRRARDEAERQLQEEADRELRSQGLRRSREEIDRRASAAAAAAALGPPTDQVPVVDAAALPERESARSARTAPAPVARTRAAPTGSARPGERSGSPVDETISLDATEQLPVVPQTGSDSVAERAASSALADDDSAERRGRHR
jgi:dTMP kinase